MGAWYEAARRGDWGQLRLDWGEMTVPIDSPETGALIRFDNSDDSFGVGVLPDPQTLIAVRHYGRLIVGPISACGKLKLYRLK